MLKEEIQDLDETPIDSDEKEGFIVHSNGKYGFMNLDGELELNFDDQKKIK